MNGSGMSASEVGRILRHLKVIQLGILLTMTVAIYIAVKLASLYALLASLGTWNWAT